DAALQPLGSRAGAAFSFLFTLPRPPKSTLFPYTTLFRSAYTVLCPLTTIVSKFHAVDSALVVYHPPKTNPALVGAAGALAFAPADRKSTRLNSSHVKISYAVFCLKKKKHQKAALHTQVRC